MITPRPRSTTGQSFVWELRDKDNNPVKNNGGVVVRVKMTEAQIRAKHRMTGKNNKLTGNRWVKVS